jgi:Ca2+-binding RTX toxin-like protein
LASECAGGVTTIRGAGGPDHIATDTGNVDLVGGAGRDDIAFVGSGVARSGAGNDTVTMSRSVDVDCGGGLRLDMGRGDDSLILPAFAAGWTTVDLHRGFAAGKHTDRVPLRGVENVHQESSPFKTGPETLIGTDGPNILIGGDASTTLRGRGGADVLKGGRGHDTAWGGTGHDRCRAEVRHECEAH